MTWLSNANTVHYDDHYWKVNVPFTFVIGFTNYGNDSNGGIYITSNNMVMFGAGSSSYGSFTAGNPPYPTLFHGAGDWQVNALLVADEVATEGRIRVRAECKDQYTLGSGSPYVYETSFYTDGRLEICYDSRLTARVISGTRAFSNGAGYWFITPSSFNIAPNTKLTFHSLAAVATGSLIPHSLSLIAHIVISDPCSPWHSCLIASECILATMISPTPGPTTLSGSHAKKRHGKRVTLTTT